jgi:hypothetical protein
MGILKKLNQWADEAEAAERGEGPFAYLAGGQEVACPHCKSAAFFERRVLLARSSGFWHQLLDKKVTALVCGHCGLIQWFDVKPERQAAVPARPEEANDA